jgi:rSAM/selenodomain-associated transferase 1
MNTVTLYTKPECHLCEPVKRAIAEVRQRREFAYVERNILDDPIDFERYKYEIPVVTLNGREIARHRMTAQELDAALERTTAFDGIAVVVMAKAPLPGRVKSRLCPPLTYEQAADVHRLFLLHLAARLEELQPDELVICFDPPESLDTMRRMLSPVCTASYIAQVKGDLGDRIADAARIVGRHHRRLLFLGVDSPDVPTAHLQDAAMLTGRASVTLGPCEDGGYWCLGLWAEVDAAGLLANISWSSGREARQTLDHAAALGYAAAVAPQWRDVDRPEDLRDLLTRLAASTDELDQRLLSDLARVLPAEMIPNGVCP